MIILIGLLTMLASTLILYSESNKIIPGNMVLVAIFLAVAGLSLTVYGLFS